MNAQVPRAFVVGCGRMGRIRAHCLQALGVPLGGVCDADDQRARSLSAEYGCPIVHELRLEHLRSNDVVFLCTPPGLRGDLPESLARAGVPLFVEKPLGVSAASAQVLRDSAGGSNGLVAVGYMNRCRASVRELAGKLRTRQILSMAGRWINSPYAVPWWTDASLSGGPFNEQATHMVDLLLLFGGPVRRVASFTSSTAQRGTTVASTLEFASGVLGTLIYSSEASFKEIGLSVYTAEETHRLEGWDFSEPSAPSVATADRNAIFLAETSQFLEAVRKRDPRLLHCGVTEALQTQRTVDALWHSAQLQQPVPVDSPASAA